VNLLAKVTGATKAQKPLSNKTEDVKGPVFEEADHAPEGDKGSEKIVAINKNVDEKTTPPASEETVAGTPVSDAEAQASSRKPLDFDGLVASSLSVEQQLQASADAFAAAGQKWTLLGDHLVLATAELQRLRGIELERDELARQRTDVKAALEKTEADLRDSKAETVKANDRATKFEEICETIKERAFEIHAALQKSRTAEQDAQTELTTLRSELVELKRVAQDDAAARLVAENRNKELQTVIDRLETDETEARNRIAKLVDDNKALAGQVPQLLSERDTLRKQFSASERENTRMLAERKTSSERIADLENEIVTLRNDLGSLTAAPSTVTVEELRPTIREAAPEAETDADDLDLVASLDLAFSEDDLQAAASDEAKRPN
jgi:chromosome segregation ATPase